MIYHQAPLQCIYFELEVFACCQNAFFLSGPADEHIFRSS